MISTPWVELKRRPGAPWPYRQQPAADRPGWILQAAVADAGQLLLVALEIEHMQVADALAVGDKRQAAVGRPRPGCDRARGGRSGSAPAA